jgi:hypothetical protein
LLLFLSDTTVTQGTYIFDYYLIVYKMATKRFVGAVLRVSIPSIAFLWGVSLLGMCAREHHFGSHLYFHISVSMWTPLGDEKSASRQVGVLWKIFRRVPSGCRDRKNKLVFHSHNQILSRSRNGSTVTKASPPCSIFELFFLYYNCWI